jgi:hypothetical protein
MYRANTLTGQYYQTSKRAVLSAISEARTPVVMKSSVFWDMTQCNLLEVNRRLGGTCRLHLQDRRIIQARNQREAGSVQALRCIPESREIFHCILQYSKA